MFDFKDQVITYPNLFVGNKLYQKRVIKDKKGIQDLVADPSHGQDGEIVEDPLNFPVYLFVSRNFKWKSYCNSIGLNSDNVFQLLEKVRILMKMAQILLIATMIQIIMTSFIINFLVFIPFAKAYIVCCGNKKVYKKMMYEQIRSGEHECLRFMRSTINQVMNLIQLVVVFTFT